MSISKVLFNECTIMDITDSTVTADSLLKGKKAYDANGDPVIGTMEPKTEGGFGNDGGVRVSGGGSYTYTFTRPITESDRCLIYLVLDPAYVSDSDYQANLLRAGISWARILFIPSINYVSYMVRWTNANYCHIASIKSYSTTSVAFTTQGSTFSSNIKEATIWVGSYNSK